MKAVPVCPYCGRVACICGSGPGRPPMSALLARMAAFTRFTPEALRTQPDEQDVFCSGCGARNQGNPCAACRRKPGGA
jgi:hypothetical protein